MTSYTDTLNSLQGSIPSSMSLNDANLVAIKAIGTTAKSTIGTMTEEGVTYVKGQLPSQGGSQAAAFAAEAAVVVNDLHTAQTTLTSITQYASQATTTLNNLKTQANGAIAGQASKINSDINKIPSQVSRKSKLYGTTVNNSLSSAQNSVNSTIQNKIALVSF